jgi:hypothetical protein
MSVMATRLSYEDDSNVRLGYDKPVSGEAVCPATCAGGLGLELRADVVAHPGVAGSQVFPPDSSSRQPS